MQIHTTQNQKEIKKHGDYAFPVYVSSEKIEAYEQGAFLWHWHPEVELTWVMSGEMEYHVNDRKYELSQGEGMFGNSNTMHAGYRKGNRDCAYLSITFHPRFLYGFESSRLQTKYVNFITENAAWPSMKLEREVVWHQEILGGVKEIYRLWEDRPKDYEIQVQIQLLLIWQKLYRYFSIQPEREQTSPEQIQRLRKILSYLEEHYQQDICLADLAEHINICKSECCRFFKKHMGMTVLEYLMSLRIQKSLPLLRGGESVTRTAGFVGFASPAYFGQIFKRYMKCTPKEYQKR